MHRDLLWGKIEGRLLPAYVWQSDMLTLWRERILLAICLATIVFGPIALVPSLLLAYIENRWDIIILDLAAYFMAVFIILERRLGLPQRAWMGISMFYFLGVGLLLGLGPFGAGYIWLFGASVMAGAMIGFRAAVAALGLNFLSLAGMYLLIVFDIPPWVRDFDNAPRIWLVMISNFMLLDTLVTLATAIMLQGLKSALDLEREVSGHLRQAENRFRLIVDNLPLMIVGYEDDNTLALWNRECLKVTGYSAAEAVLRPETVLEFHSDDTAEITSLAQWLEKGGSFEIREQALKHRDGSRRIVAWRNLSDLVKIPGLRHWAAGLDITKRKEAEEELLENSYKNRVILENATEGIMVIQDGLFKFFNKKVAMMIGFPPEELMEQGDRSFLSWVHAGDRELVAERYLSRQMGDPVPTEYWIRILKKDGEPIWVEVSSTVITWARRPATLTFMTDITAKKQAEDRLRDSEKRFKEMANLLPTIIVEVDLEGRIIYSNDAGFTTFEYDAREISGELHISEFITGDDLSKLMEIFQGVIKTGVAPAGAEYRFKTKKEKEITCFAQMRPMEHQGKIQGIRASLMDITDIKRTRLNLKASEEKHRNILESIEEGYYEVDLFGNLTFFNRGLSKILDYPEEELAGLNYRQFMDEETIREAYRVFRNVHDQGISTTAVDWVVIRKDGATRHVETSLSLIRDLEGKAVGFRGVARDVTERKVLFEARQKQVQAETANQAKSEFLARMSHEIRTPLNAVIGMTELAMGEELGERLQKIMETISSESLVLMNLVNRILDFSKIEAQRLELETIPFELAYLLEDIADSAAMEAGKKDLELILFVQPQVPTRLIGDPGRLRQILTNLMANAVKFTNKGEVLLKVEKVGRMDGRVDLRFMVKDTGIGISEEKQKEIFDAFTQVHGSTTRHYGGTGLGTTISKMLVELMGGEIKLVSREGEGSTFSFIINFEIQPDSPPDFQWRDTDLSGNTIIMVNDNPTYRHVLTSYLESWGCRVLEAGSQEEAIAAIERVQGKSDRIGLVLTDLHLSGKSGLELAAAIKGNPSWAYIPIIVLTDVGRLGDGRRCREIGVQGYLSKPVRRDDLYHMVRIVLGENGTDRPERRRTLVTKHILPEMERSRINILLVEDYPTNQTIATEHLTSHGFRVELASNGAEALAAFQKRRFDLILMDIQMPIMDGYEAARRIRELENRLHGRSTDPDAEVHVPIVAMTAHAFKGYRQECLQAGMDDYLTKPLLRQELIDMVEKWTYKARRSPDRADDSPGGRLEEQDECPGQFDEGEPIPGPGEAMNDLPLDYDALVKEFMGKEGLVRKTVVQFVQTVEKQLPVLEKAINGGSLETIAAEAHAIKGGAANLTAGRLSRAAQNLEMAVRSGRMEDGRRLLLALESEFKSLEEFLRSSQLIV